MHATSVQQGVASLTGGEMESLLQVLEVCLRGLLKQDELKCWTLHINIMCLLRDSEEWTDEVLQQLTDDTLLWKAQMFCL